MSEHSAESDARCNVCGQSLDTFPCPVSWDSEHRPRHDETRVIPSGKTAENDALARAWDAGYFAALDDLHSDRHTDNPHRPTPPDKTEEEK